MFQRYLILSSILCALLVGSACRSSSNNEAHYAELEKHRQNQAQQSPTTAPATAASPSPQASVSPSPGQTAGPPVAARNYWTNFRGPKRDGKYEETPVSTS